MTAPFSSEKRKRRSRRMQPESLVGRGLSAPYPKGGRRARSPHCLPSKGNRRATRPGGQASTEESRGSRSASVAIELGAVFLEPFARHVDRARRELAAE